MLLVKKWERDFRELQRRSEPAETEVYDLVTSPIFRRTRVLLERNCDSAKRVCKLKTDERFTRRGSINL